ncbi:hypothetical protein ERO13_A10G184701v2 [Gossypium hirsutum]|uniref:Rad60/SUMO-like domain-containing protein n=1 Tax=Gossypium tomentosum TaxID=34277 RepID=A0A5D2NV47_GOSTO|nr:hypothetical protein ERO13_A10G184701v2 [Gossypium hirsutum]TYI07323.1 hypothetical protein ES332_A10G220400v1 [Gossypium tomentosum]
METSRRITATQSTLISLSESEVKDNEERFLLKLQSGLKHPDQYYYWMGRNTPFKELIIDYTRRIDVPLSSVRFLFDDSPINPLFSANRLELEDGDSIDVIRRDVSASTETTLISLPRAKGEMPITLKVGLFGTDHHLLYLIGRSTPLEYLFLDYADRTSLFYEKIRFYIQKRWLLIDPKKTSDDYKMEDGGIICWKPLPKNNFS